MRYDLVTWLLIAAVPVVWIVWDVILGLREQKTESMWLATWARDWNVLPFTVGVLVGHWFMQNPSPHYSWWPAALCSAVLVLVYDLACREWSVKGGPFRILAPARWLRYPGLWLGLGLPVGFLFWPQRLP